MRTIINPLVSFILAWIALSVVSTALGAQFVLANLSKMGGTVGLSDWFNVTFGDAFAMLPIYSLFNGRGVWAIFFGIALLLSLAGAGVVVKWAPLVFRNNKHIVYPLAGFVGIIIGLEILNMAVEMILESNVVLIAPTRTYFGIVFQALAGAVGGYIYYLSRQRFNK